MAAKRLSTEEAIEQQTRVLREHQQKVGKPDPGYEAARKIVQDATQQERAKEQKK